MDDATRMERLRALPSIDELLARRWVVSLLSGRPRPLAVKVLQRAVACARERLLRGEDRPLAEDDVVRSLGSLAQPNLRPVLNATGVVLHTNLGRSPLPGRAIERLGFISKGYCNLELELDEGERGSRYAPVLEALCALTGAEDALVVNNCAAAVLLTFSALAAGKDAIVSRGELVEIGGGFRVPDVMRQSGARLIEVGTTNRTTLADYASALGPESALVVKVHRSNFAMVGFTHEVSTRELAELASRHGLPLFEDLGSGALRPLHAEGLTQEPTVASVVAAGADVVAFSADKLLGGPQAGILVGRRAVLERLKTHPLNRALRIDKLTIAALEATLEVYRDELEDTEIPARMLLLQPLPLLEERARRLAKALEEAGIASRVVRAEGRVGGGAMPLSVLPSWAVSVRVSSANQMQERLRALDPPLLARTVDEEVWLDVRCLAEADIQVAARCVAAAAEGT